MERKEFRELRSVEDARELVGEISVKPGSIVVSLQDAPGHITARDIFSDIDVPAFNRSVKDGYAVLAKDTYHASEPEPVKLTCTASIPAGCADKYHVKEGTAIEISTGAPIPDGADAVVMVENTKQEGNDLFVYQPVHIGENIMRAGSDIMKGQRILRRNTPLGSREIGVLASIGVKDVHVKQLLVGIVSTGSELIEPGSELGAGKIYDANSYAIAAAIKECGATPRIYDIVEDDETLMEQALDRAVMECDIVLTSGSTSAGVGDIMYMIIERKGETLTHGIAIKPGKPVVIGMIGEVPTIGLPGNPTSALIIFNEFVAPVIYNSLGVRPSFKTKIKATMGTGIRSGGREELLPVGLVRGRAYPADKTSGAITTLSEADGTIEIRAHTEYIEAGSEVEVTLFGNVMEPDLMLVGGQCPGIDIIEDMTGLVFRTLYMGSSAGFTAISGGTTDIACVNMIDGNGKYNASVIERMGLEDVVLVKGYRRELGLIFNKDRPVHGLEDITQMQFINRNRGSGTRTILDRELRKLAEDRGIAWTELTSQIKGYNSGSKTHRSVCDAVKSKKADLGFGLRAMAEEAGLGFIKTCEDEFDLVIRKDLVHIKEIQMFLDVLGSVDFKKRLPEGINTYEMTGRIISSF